MKKDEHPIQISAGFNPQMKKFDLVIFVGNFADEKAARDYAKNIVEFLEREANGNLQRAQ